MRNSCVNFLAKILIFRWDTVFTKHGRGLLFCRTLYVRMLTACGCNLCAYFVCLEPAVLVEVSIICELWICVNRLQFFVYCSSSNLSPQWQWNSCNGHCQHQCIGCMCHAVTVNVSSVKMYFIWINVFMLMQFLSAWTWLWLRYSKDVYIVLLQHFTYWCPSLMLNIWQSWPGR